MKHEIKNRMEVTFLLSLVFTTMEMTICLSCALHLWRTRNAARDHSRFLLILGSLVSGILALFSVALIIVNNFINYAHPVVLNPLMGLIYVVMNIIMTLYPISVVKPDWLSPRRYTMLFLAPALLTIGYLVFIGRWTPLATTADIWANLSAPDVWIRLIALFIMPFYNLILFFLPRNFHKSSASLWWIVNYVFGLLTLSVVHIILMLTHASFLFAFLPFLAASFYFFSMEYEVNDRLLPSAQDQQADSPEKTEAIPAMEFSSPEAELWDRISRLMDQEEVWRNPDLSLTSLARMCATNITYLNRIIQKETGNSYKELINAKRIASVAAQLNENPDVDIQDAFFNAGYRSRTTAWRNFKDILGVTPTEFRQTLKQQ